MVGVEIPRRPRRVLQHRRQRHRRLHTCTSRQGSIADFDSAGADALIALHACDTATDDAIAKGIAAGSELIVVAPCCHKQIRREMETSNRGTDLDFVTRHGIFLERQAEMVTDAMRAMILEHFGYSTKVFEFVSDVHTPKNVLIVATKKKGGKDAAAFASSMTRKPISASAGTISRMRSGCSSPD
ncbi:MAG: methyltransferase [Rubrivivax sp.]